MTDLVIMPDALEITMDAACDLSLECWWLSHAAASSKEMGDGAIVRYSVRRIAEVLKGIGFETTDLTGRTYDAGLAPEVMNVVWDDTVPDGQTLIDETISPIITWRGRIVRPGQIVVKRAPSKKQMKTD
jgi:hypothetical protein